jgi:hypothetical protein
MMLSLLELAIAFLMPVACESLRGENVGQNRCDHSVSGFSSGTHRASSSVNATIRSPRVVFTLTLPFIPFLPFAGQMELVAH